MQSLTTLRNKSIHILKMRRVRNVAKIKLIAVSNKWFKFHINICKYRISLAISSTWKTLIDFSASFFWLSSICTNKTLFHFKTDFFWCSWCQSWHLNCYETLVCELREARGLQCDSLQYLIEGTTWLQVTH